MKVACYLRVSTDHQSLESQRAILEKYVKDMGWNAHYYEEVESTRRTRPIKASLLEKIRNGEYSVLIVTKLDRYARSSRELILEIDELTRKNITFISIGDNLDFTSAGGKLLFHLLSSFAEFERSIISYRVKTSLQRLKESGVILGRPKGAKDRGKRRKSGYILREAHKRQIKDQTAGKFKHIETYIK